MMKPFVISTKTLKSLYYVSTIFIVIQMTFMGILLITENSFVISIINHLGYETYFARALGFSKLLGVIALVTNKFPKLKEHAYFAFALDFLAAAFSHYEKGDPALYVLFPILTLEIIIISYLTWERISDFHLHNKKTA